MGIEQTVVSLPASHGRRRGLLQTYGDLLLLVGAVGGAALLIELPFPLLRVPLGLALSLLAPGYVLAAALFPDHQQLDGAARGALSFGLSVAVLPLLALVLSSLPWGLRPWPMMIALSAWIVLLSAAAALRRRRLPLRMPPDPTVGAAPRAPLPRSGAIASSAALLGIGLFALLWAQTATLARPPSGQATAFYALSASGQLENYPREVALGTPVELRLGIINHDASAATYRIEVRSARDILTTVGPLLLAPGATWEQPVRYTLAQPGEDQRVEIVLLREGEPSPYRQLQLWMNVRESQP